MKNEIKKVSRVTKKMQRIINHIRMISEGSCDKITIIMPKYFISMNKIYASLLLLYLWFINKIIYKNQI